MKRAWTRPTKGDVNEFCEFHEYVLIFNNLLMIFTSEKVRYHFITSDSMVRNDNLSPEGKNTIHDCRSTKKTRRRTNCHLLSL